MTSDNTEVDGLFDKYLGSNGVAGSADLLPKNKQLKAEVSKLLLEAQEDILSKVMEKYGEKYQRMAKELGVDKPTPYTALHQIIDDELAELKQKGSV